MSKQMESLASTMGTTDEKNVIPPLAGSYQNLDAEKVLKRLGKYGTYQMIIFAMSSIGLLLYSTETMIMSLITKDVEFLCISDDPNFRVIDKCTVQNVASNASFTCGQVAKTYLQFNESARNSLTGEFELVCDKSYWSQHSTSVFMIASQLATPFVATLSDKYGRRLTFLLPLWIAVIANICCSISPTYYFFLVFRFIAGVGSAGVTSVGFVIQIESVTASFRSVSPLFMTFVWVFGYMIVGVLHMFIPNWRWLYFSISAPGLITFAFFWMMPESIHWMISNNRSDGVRKYIKQSCRLNRREVHLHECRSAHRMDDLGETEEKRGGFLDLFRSWPLVFHLILHCYIMIVMNGCYWALSLFSVDLHENEMIGYFLSGLVELPAGFISIALLLYFGRRFVTSASLILQALCMLFAVLYPGKSFISMMFPLLAKVFNSFAWASEPLLIGEMSPTVVRNVFFGCIGFVGEIGSILAPYTNALKEIHELAPPFVICAMSLIAALASLLSPETKDKPLPETIEDFDAGPVYRWLFGSKKAEQKSTKRTNSTEVHPPILSKEKETVTLLDSV